jgi:hypothetical protein
MNTAKIHLKTIVGKKFLGKTQKQNFSSGFDLDLDETPDTPSLWLPEQRQSGAKVRGFKWSSAASLLKLSVY